jgi:outer membrane protein TolC
LPLFNRNQGNIAIETATREKLHAEYTNRVAADIAEIQGMLSDQALLTQQLARTRAAADEADRTARGARNAYAATLIDARTNADLITAALTRRQEVVAIEQALLEQQIALATLTGIAMPVSAPLPDPEGPSQP